MIFKYVKCVCSRYRDITGKLTNCKKCGQPVELSERWYVKFIGSNGRPQEIAVSSRKKDAELYLQQMKVAKATGQTTDREPIVSFNDACDLYLKTLGHLRESTKYTYGFHLATLKRYFSELDLTDFDNVMVLEFIKRRQGETSHNGKSISPNTINHELTCLKSVFRAVLKTYQAKHDMPKLNRVFNSVLQVKELDENMRDKRLTNNEIQTLLSHCDGHTKLAVQIGIYTGLRLSNVLNLTWKQIDFANQTITIDESEMKDKDTLTIPMPDALKFTLQSYKLTQPISPYVFRVKYINRSLRTAMKKAGIQGATFHTLRHSFATGLLESGVDIATVADLLGHADCNFTRKQYSHTDMAHRASAVDKFVDKLVDNSK